MKLASVHQPHFFPWPSYFSKILISDVFIFLDDVQFRKNYFQNRCQIIDLNDSSAKWLTAPIKKKTSSRAKINKVLFSENYDNKSILSILARSYSEKPFFENIFPDIEELLMPDYQNLADLNINTILWCLKKLEINTEILVNSRLELIDTNDPSMRLIDICKYTNSTKYLAGQGGRSYMNIDLFNKNDIEVMWFDSSRNIYKYPQFNETFISGLSILDMFFNVGYEASSEILLKNRFEI